MKPEEIEALIDRLTGTAMALGTPGSAINAALDQSQIPKTIGEAAAALRFLLDEKGRPVRENQPRKFDLENPDERRRLLRELYGYMKVSLLDGTDGTGRMFACDGIRRLVEGVEAGEYVVARVTKASLSLTPWQED